MYIIFIKCVLAKVCNLYLGTKCVQFSCVIHWSIGRNTGTKKRRKQEERVGGDNSLL